jgi:Fe-S oxidoreductase/nitrate reductase gamma subunit
MTPGRAFFWKIEDVWVFYVIAALAVALLFIGVAAHILVWLKGAPRGKPAFSRKALKQTILDTFSGRRVFKGNLSAGIMHLLIFSGFVILFVGTSLLAVHEYVYPFLAGNPYLVFEVSMDIGGVLLLAGIIWALIRRYIQRVPRLERRLEDVVVPVWLLVVAASGFMLEGLRLAAQQPSWGQWSFAGAWIAGLVPNSTAESSYPYFWWGHALLSLGFIAIIPFTKLFHMLGAPAAFYLHRAVEGSGEISAPLPEVAEIVPNAEEAPLDFGETPLTLGEVVFYDACMRCGRCSQVCPSTGAGEPFAPREFVQAARQALWRGTSRFGDIQFLNGGQPPQDKSAWYCTTCAACLEVCPVYGAPFKVVSKRRAALVMEGKEVPDLMNQTLERLFNYDNPWVASKRERAVWAKDLEIPALKKGQNEGQLCYFVGCTTSFDARAQGIARSFSSILKRAGVGFGILGEKEPCCGDIARVVGEAGLYLEKMEGCLDLFEQYGIREVVTSSPHCFHTFLNEYSGRPFEVRHYALVLMELLAEGRLKLEKPLNTTVTYHDPCYLGRHNRIFEEPRKIIRSIPGIELIEMSHHGPDSLCCGGGGGRMWQGQELRGEARMGEIRIREAHATGAETLITACPLCLIMLEDASKTLGLDRELKVMDLNELVLNSLG